MAAVSHNEWQLRQQLVVLSRAETFQEALREWRIDGVEDLEAEEESKKCLCCYGSSKSPHYLGFKIPRIVEIEPMQLVQNRYIV